MWNKIILIVLFVFGSLIYKPAQSYNASLSVPVLTPAPSQSAHVGPAKLYPDSSLTPGKADTLSVATLVKRYTDHCPRHKKNCTYSQHQRNVSAAEHTHVYDEYNVPKSKRNKDAGEVDHLAPLCAGGSNDISNLWYQPAKNMWNGKNFGYHEKDRLETWICVQIKAGKLNPKDAFKRMIEDWVTYFKEVNPPHRKFNQ